jgi:DNA-binding NarL/FixJ family response regulator
MPPAAIADDQAMVREGLAAILAAQPGLKVVGLAADGADAVAQARRLSPDIVLMDVRMPVMDGLQATREILRGTAGQERPRVLMLTTFDLGDYVYQALRAGRILSKLGLRDRAQAVVVAYESGLVTPGSR